MLKVDILVASESLGSVIYGLYDTLMLPGTAWPNVVLGQRADPLVRVRIVSKSGEYFECRGGVPVRPHASLTEAEDCDIVCIPNMTIPYDQNPKGWYREEIRWLRARYEKGSTIASVCSGSLLLAEAGLLDGKEATAHWSYEPMFRRYYPSVDFRPERTLTFAGDGDRLVLAGGVTSWQDLVLYLIARFLDPEQAVQVAKLHLLAGHDDGQLLYSALPRRIQKSDRVISRCQIWLADNYGGEGAISQMLELSGLTRRTFSRRFRAATGYSPVEYIQALRIEESKQLLEATEMSIADIARAVGYNDEGAFRRTFFKRSGVSPSTYRKKFSYAKFRRLKPSHFD